MRFRRKSPLFTLALIIAAVLVLGELGLIYERFSAAREAGRRLEQRKAELQAMTELTPPPTRATATAIETDLARAEQALAAMQRELKGRGPAAERIRQAKLPAARTDAYFDLATFVEKTRELAKKHEIEIRPEAARLGFAAYANEGPTQEHIEPVFRQRQIAQYLLESLIEARPNVLLGVKREPTLNKADREARATALANGEPPPEMPEVEGPDYFVVDPRVTARVPGYIDTTAFRLVFVGQTAALRTFVNRLASFELPVLVREIEVEPATTEESTAQAAPEEALASETAATPIAASIVLSADAPATKPAAKSATRSPRASTATPIVSKALSKFTLTVECVELVPPAAPATAEDSAPAPQS